jgi:hypothetical protein
VHRAEVAEHLQGRFAVLADLPPEGSDPAAYDPEAEWASFCAAARAAVQSVPALAHQQARRPKQCQLSTRTAQLIQSKQQAWQNAQQAEGTPAAPAARVAYNRCNNAARRAVAKDRQRHYDRVASKAAHSLRAGHTAAFFRHVRRLFADKEGAHKGVAEAGVFDASGQVVRRGRSAAVARFQEFLAGLLQSGGEVSVEVLQRAEQLAADVEAEFALGRYTGSGEEHFGDPPTVHEVQAAVKALRNDAAPGVDGIVAPLLKVGSVMAVWLHRVITAVWASGRAPVEWKRALIVPLYKGKGDRKAVDNYRGISLLSIPGKVYATIIMRRVYAQMDDRLHECQSAFRKGRSLGDAVFTLRMIMSKCREFGKPAYMAFVDLRKAYDSVPRELLWLALRQYGVHPRLQALLFDLHVGTQAAVKLEGVRAREWFDVDVGVRQGCVIAPLLFNMFMDMMVKVALSRMPADCGVHLAYDTDGELFGSAWNDDACSDQLIRMLLYADDLVLISHQPDTLAEMLKVLDDVCLEFGMSINASKTELLSMDVGGDQPAAADVELASGVARQVQAFKYLGGVVDPCGTCDKELAVRIAKALGQFKSMKRVWWNKRVRLRTKVQLYKCYVLPILRFGSEFWALTKQQAHRLEVVHNRCMREMLHVRLIDRVSLELMRQRCRLPSMEQMLRADRLQWLGHVLRMDDHRLPRIALLSRPKDGQRAVGRPRRRFTDCIREDLHAAGVPLQRVGEGGLNEQCGDRAAWRKMCQGMSCPPAG